MERKIFRDLKKKKTPKPKKVAATSVVEASEQSVAKDKTPAGEGGEVAAIEATTPLAVNLINVDDEPDEAEPQLERKKRKISAADKGKGKEGAMKKTRHELPTPSEGERDSRGVEIYDDPSTAATLMAKITYPGDNSPIPGKLMLSDLYNEWSSRQAKALAHLNRMVVSYDQEARSRELFIGEARAKEEAEKKKVAEKTAKLVAELESEKRSSLDTLKHLQSLTVEKRKGDERLAELEKEMSAMRANHQREMEKAVSEARRTAAAEVQAHLNSARESYEKLLKRPIKHMVYYSQVEANLQLLALIEKGQAAGTFDFAAERAELIENKAKFAKFNGVFDEIAVELRKTLGKNYVVPVNVKDLIYSPRLETVAKSVGVITASGSNDGSLGMRLLQDESSSDSDESQESEPRDIDETLAQAQGDVQAQEVATVLRQSELAPSNPVAEKTTVDAASSATAAAQAEGIEKEAGEL